MYRISKVFKFSAGHFLTGLPGEHPCSNQHGHNYTAELFLEAESVNHVGFIVDYNDLIGFKNLIDKTLDHKNLNDVVTFNPTAENLARYLCERAGEFWWSGFVSGVRVSETDGTTAEFIK